MLNYQAVGKKNTFCHFVVVVQLIHRLTQADISCTTPARLFFFPLLANYTTGIYRLSWANADLSPNPTEDMSCVRHPISIHLDL